MKASDKKLPVAENEQERIKALQSYHILDTLPEEDFDAITRLAAYICQVPIALVSLIDVNRQWFKSRLGLDTSETHRDFSFCQYAIMEKEIFEIPDAHADERFADNPLVTGKPYIRFYAGAPLMMPDGFILGTLCVIDTVPKKLTPEQKDAMRTLAKEVVTQIVLRKQQKELQKEKEFAQQALLVKEQFLANMSHEIRTPLNGIAGLTHLLMDTPINQQQKDYLRYISQCSENLLVIINELLDFSKIESGKLTFESIDFDLGVLFNSTLSILKIKAAEKGLLLESHISADTPNFLMGDPFKLNQILNNLIGNAIKFTEAGKVSISVENSLKTAEEVTLLFTIQDTGIGIPADKLSVIFESFTQANNDTTRKYGGTGLGLAITKKLVEQQNGQIWLSSTLGEGSLFQFSLPFKINVENVKSNGVDKTAVEKNIHYLKKISVLIAEDNVVNQLITTKILKDQGFEITIAEDGKSVIDKLQESEFDIILMDIQMPHMDGYQAMKFIRNNMSAKSTIPIIALTAHATKEEVEKCFYAGANDYLSKPFEPEALIKKIENWVITAREQATSHS